MNDFSRVGANSLTFLSLLSMHLLQHHFPPCQRTTIQAHPTKSNDLEFFLVIKYSPQVSTVVNAKQVTQEMNPMEHPSGIVFEEVLEVP